MRGYGDKGLGLGLETPPTSVVLMVRDVEISQKKKRFFSAYNPHIL